MWAVLVLGLLFLGGVVQGHPPATFSMLLDMPNPNTTAGVPYNLTFYLYDMWNNNAIVNFTELLPMHARYLHAMLASDDLEAAFHLHPDDFSTMEAMMAKNNYFVTLNFPKSGRWFLATSFMANINGRWREGAAQIEFVVPASAGQPGPNTPHYYDYKNVGMYRTYPIGSNDIFNQFVDIRNNTVTTGGYTVTLTVAGGNMTGIASYTCQPFYLTIVDEMGMPVTNFVPYLDAPFHATFAADDDTVYHGHGMDLTDIADTLEKIEEDAMYMDQMFMGMNMSSTTGMSMSSTTGMNMNMSSTTFMNMNTSTTTGTNGGSMNMTKEMELVIMNAFMMGVTNKGKLNCTADLGPAMQNYKMDPYEPMLPTSNYTFGNKFIGLFDFPNVGNWRVWFYFKIQVGNETRLLVPTFSFATADSPNTPTVFPPTPSPPPQDESSSSGNEDHASTGKGSAGEISPGSKAALATCFVALAAFVITAGYFYHKNGHLCGLALTKQGVRPARADDYVAFTERETGRT